MIKFIFNLSIYSFTMFKHMLQGNLYFNYFDYKNTFCKIWFGFKTLRNQSLVYQNQFHLTSEQMLLIYKTFAQTIKVCLNFFVV